ncbi:hypothetical protein CBM2589_A70433 [Cupriavidus taiwanensis]|uniref:Integrase catalytic domain-containing protein n=1 Tax=Cupriavidus taiwanensis TaxID=164546 RepID=A0A975XB98_9BURK|nr:hypothetical protein CBM2589_A70433 [Cupriavidus taiwanensis]
MPSWRPCRQARSTIMGRPDTITMSMQELDRCKVIQAVVEDGLMVWRAAEKLGISKRQVERLAQRYRQDGARGLVSRKWGQPGHHQLPPGLESRVRGLIRDSYADFGPTLATEKLRERHGIEISPACVRRIMIDAGFWVPRKLRPPKVHQPRNRRACLGELVQIDGSDHAWFEDRAPACTLLVYVDDATGKLMQLQFVPTESTPAYFSATRAYVERHGKPMAFYSDKFSVFRVNARDSAEGRGYTQFGRALFELNIDILCANSSPAKGRVERVPGQCPGQRRRPRLHPVRARAVRAEHRHPVRQFEPGQGPGRADERHAAGPAGQGTAPARHQHHGRGQCLCPAFHRRLQRALCQGAEERVRCAPAAARRRGPGTDLQLARMAQGVAEPHAAVRQGAVPARGPARAPAPDSSLSRGGRVPGRQR